MVARCETVGKYVLPVFRSLIARELTNKYGLTQVTVAQMLGTTQAAISHYLNSKRAYKGTEKLNSVMPQLTIIASEVAMRLTRGEIRPDEITFDFCRMCPSICKKATIETAEDFAI